MNTVSAITLLAQGNLFFDCLACIFCGHFAPLQEFREVPAYRLAQPCFFGLLFSQNKPSSSAQQAAIRDKKFSTMTVTAGGKFGSIPDSAVATLGRARSLLRRLRRMTRGRDSAAADHHERGISPGAERWHGASEQPSSATAAALHSSPSRLGHLHSSESD